MTGRERVMDRCSGMEKGPNATGVRETKRRRKSRLTVRSTEKRPKTDQRLERSIFAAVRYCATLNFFGRAGALIFNDTCPAAFFFSSIFSLFHKGCFCVWQEATVLMHYG